MSWCGSQTPFDPDQAKFGLSSNQGPHPARNRPKLSLLRPPRWRIEIYYRTLTEQRIAPKAPALVDPVGPRTGGRLRAATHRAVLPHGGGDASSNASTQTGGCHGTSSPFAAGGARQARRNGRQQTTGLHVRLVACCRPPACDATAGKRCARQRWTDQ